MEHGVRSQGRPSGEPAAFADERVRALSATAVSVPYRHPEISSRVHRLGLTNVIVELETSTGRIGLGECARGPSTEAVLAALETARPLVEGELVANIERVRQRFYRVAGWDTYRHSGNFALAGVEMAMWDLLGQVAGLPVCDLFGGALHERIPVFAYLQVADPEAMATEAEEAVRRGHRAVYFKVGMDAERELAQVAAVRATIGPSALRVDANGAWSIGQAIAILRRLARYDLDFVEQPVMELEGLREVRAATGIRVAANESAWTEREVLEVVRRQAADIIVTGPQNTGGLLSFRRAAAVAELAGLPICRHSHGELGIGTAAALHVLATCPNLDVGNQTYDALLSDDVMEGGLQLAEDGCLRVPAGPGLGVRLDRDKLRTFAELYRRQGAYRRNETASHADDRWAMA